MLGLYDLVFAESLAEFERQFLIVDGVLADIHGDPDHWKQFTGIKWVVHSMETRPGVQPYKSYIVCTCDTHRILLKREAPHEFIASFNVVYDSVYAVQMIFMQRIH